MQLFSKTKVLAFVLAATLIVGGSSPSLSTVKAVEGQNKTVNDQGQKLEIELVVPDFETGIGAANIENCDLVATLDNEQNTTINVSVQEQIVQEDEYQKEFIMANVADSVNIRAEASEESEKIGVLYKNCGGELIEKGEEWSHITSGELEGWIKNEYLFFGSEAQALAEEVGEDVVTIETDCLRARMEPSEDAGVLGLLAVGSEYTLIDDCDGWVSIKFDNDTAYVSKEYVSIELIIPEGETIEEIKEREALSKASKETLRTNRGALSASVDDVTLLAALIYCEAGNQSYDGKVGVGAVVCNRVRSGNFPNSVYDVIYAPHQFGPAGSGKVARAIENGINQECIDAATAALNGETTVGEARYFKRAGTHDGITIGDHVFY